MATHCSILAWKIPWTEVAFLAGRPVGFSCSLAFSSYIRILVEMGRDTGIRGQSSQENKF